MIEISKSKNAELFLDLNVQYRGLEWLDKMINTLNKLNEGEYKSINDLWIYDSETKAEREYKERCYFIGDNMPKPCSYRQQQNLESFLVFM